MAPSELLLTRNCCPNDAGVTLGCCPGGGSVIPSPAVAAVPKDSKRLCQNNPACQELNLLGMCCPNPAGASLGSAPRSKLNGFCALRLL